MIGKKIAVLEQVIEDLEAYGYVPGTRLLKHEEMIEVLKEMLAGLKTDTKKIKPATDISCRIG